MSNSSSFDFYNMPFYGGNFVDIMFRYVMQNGLQVISIGLIIQIIIYLSLDSVKKALSSSVDYIFKLIYDKYKNRSLSTISFYRRFFMRKITKYMYTSKEIIQLNSFKYMINVENKLDMLAVCHKLLETRQYLLPTNMIYCKETNSATRIEQIILPNQLEMNDNITVVVENGMVQIIFEGGELEHLKDFKIYNNSNNIFDKSQLINDVRFFMEANKYNINHVCDERLSSEKVINQMYAGLGTFINSENWLFLIITKLLYDNKETDIKSFINFLNNAGTFIFLGRTYKLGAKNMFNDILITELPTIIKNANSVYVSYIQCRPAILYDYLTKYQNILNKDTTGELSMYIEFTDAVKSSYELSLDARKYMNILVENWRKISTEKNSQVSIYMMKTTEQTSKIEETISKEDVSNDMKDPRDKSHKMDDKKTNTIFKKIITVDSIFMKKDYKPYKHLYLQEKMSKILTNYLNNFNKNADLFSRFGFRHKGGILLYGTPGCGKTTCITAVATYLNKDIYYIDLKDIDTNDKLKACLDKINQNGKGGIIVFEDIDCMSNVALKRDGTMQINERDKLTLSFVLNCIDGAMSLNDCIYIITTNKIDKLDEAILRPGRMDIKMELTYCNRYQLKNIYMDLYNNELEERILKKFDEHKYTTSEVIIHLFYNISSQITVDELFSKFIITEVNETVVV